jgi:hypothetical protein
VQRYLNRVSAGSRYVGDLLPEAQALLQGVLDAVRLSSSMYTIDASDRRRGSGTGSSGTKAITHHLFDGVTDAAYRILQVCIHVSLSESTFLLTHVF